MWHHVSYNLLIQSHLFTLWSSVMISKLENSQNSHAEIIKKLRGKIGHCQISGVFQREAGWLLVNQKTKVKVVVAQDEVRKWTNFWKRTDAMKRWLEPALPWHFSPSEPGEAGTEDVSTPVLMQPGTLFFPGSTYALVLSLPISYVTQQKIVWE